MLQDSIWYLQAPSNFTLINLVASNKQHMFKHYTMSLWQISTSFYVLKLTESFLLTCFDWLPCFYSCWSYLVWDLSLQLAAASRNKSRRKTCFEWKTLRVSMMSACVSCRGIDAFSGPNIRWSILWTLYFLSMKHDSNMHIVTNPFFFGGGAA